MTKKLNDQTATVDSIKQKVKAFRDERKWHNEDPKDIALSLILEASELLEHFQWKTGEEVRQEARLFGPVCDELADVLWWVLVLAEKFDIDMTQAFEKKLEKNAVKYPVEIFKKIDSQKGRTREYYKIKAKYRGGHPLADEE